MAVLPMLAGLVVAAVVWGVLTLRVARRFGCAMSVILGLTLIPTAAAVVMGAVIMTLNVVMLHTVSGTTRITCYTPGCDQQQPPGVVAEYRPGGTPTPFRFLTPTPARPAQG